MTFRWGVSPERKARGVTTVSSRDSITAIRCAALDFQGSTATFLNRSIASAGLPFWFSKIDAIRNWPCAAGSEPGNFEIRVSQAAIASSNFSCGTKLSPTWKRICGTRRVERVLGDERRPGGAGVGVLLAAEGLGGDQELGVEDRALGVGRLGAVGELGEISLPGGDRLVELLLALEDLARPGTWPSSRARRRSRLRLVGLGPIVLAGEEGVEGGDGLVALAPREVRGADLVRRPGPPSGWAG